MNVESELDRLYKENLTWAKKRINIPQLRIEAQNAFIDPDQMVCDHLLMLIAGDDGSLLPARFDTLTSGERGMWGKVFDQVLESEIRENALPNDVRERLNGIKTLMQQSDMSNKDVFAQVRTEWITQVEQFVRGLPCYKEAYQRLFPE